MGVRLFRFVGLIGVFSTLISCLYVVFDVFSILGLRFPLDVVSIPEPYKSIVSLYATLIGFLILFVIFMFRLHTWFSSPLLFSSSLVSIFALISPILYGLSFPMVIPLLIFGFTLSLISGFAILFRVEKPTRIFSLSALEVSVTAILSALQAFLTASVGAIFPSPTGGYTHIGDTITFLAAYLFGVKISTLTGVIGSLAADFYLGYPRWYVSILAHGLEGLIAGLSYRRGVVLKVLLSLLAGFSMAFTYFYINIFIKGYAPALISFMRDFFGQALISLIIALILYKPLERALRAVMHF